MSIKTKHSFSYSFALELLLMHCELVSTHLLFIGVCRCLQAFKGVHGQGRSQLFGKLGEHLAEQSESGVPRPV